MMKSLPSLSCRMSLLVLLIALILLKVSCLCNGLALVSHGRPQISSRSTFRNSRWNRRMSNMDYEYLPPHPSAPAPYSTNLKSIYPPDTPAGLRGEAVRSALRSTRCLAWNLSDSPLSTGWILVEGKGTTDFLQNKFSQSFVSYSANDDGRGRFTQAYLLDAKGKVVDLVGIAQTSPTTAFLWTSPGHSGSQLYQRLDPLIFPMDQITLEDATKTTRIFSVASTKMEHVKKALRSYVAPLLGGTKLTFPSSDSECVTISLEDDASLLVLPSVDLPSCACVGCTLVFLGDNSNRLGERVWNALTGDENPEGPIELGPLEYETLRIEAGWPAFGKELTGAAPYSKKKNDDAKESKVPAAGPLELHWQSYLDLDKGCYLGQEGVASVVKNPRGPPRLLYSVVFDDDDNVYQHQSEGEKSSCDSRVENLTVLPQEGQELFVLGSNEQISVGTLTSVAEPSGTGEAVIVALALVRRADSILKQMKDMDLEFGASSFQETPDPIESDGSGMIAPPPLDPLDGLEVIVGGSFTVGRLQMVPSRRYRVGQNMFEDVEIYEPEEGAVMGYLQREPTSTAEQSPIPVTPEPAQEESEEDIEKVLEEAAKAEAEAEAAAAEAQRKAEKMEMLKRRAEEAMARRKQKKTEQ